MIFDGFVNQLPDIDPVETEEWLDSLDAVVETRGKTRARYLLSRLLERARESQFLLSHHLSPRRHASCSRRNPKWSGAEGTVGLPTAVRREFQLAGPTGHFRHRPLKRGGGNTGGDIINDVCRRRAPAEEVA